MELEKKSSENIEQQPDQGIITLDEKRPTLNKYISYLVIVAAFLLLFFGYVFIANLNQIRDESFQAYLPFNNLRGQGEVYWTNHAESYKGFCDSKEVTDAFAWAEPFNLEEKYCYDSKDAWAAEIKIEKHDTYFCVDSTHTATKSPQSAIDAVTMACGTTDVTQTESRTDGATWPLTDIETPDKKFLNYGDLVKEVAGIQAFPLSEISSSSMNRFAYTKTENGIVYINWPWSSEHSYQGFLTFLSDNSDNELISFDRYAMRASEVDEETFEVFAFKDHITPFAKDKNHFYMFGTVVPELDPNSAKVVRIGRLDSTAGGNVIFFAVDKDHVYYLGRYGIKDSLSLQSYKPGLLSEADPNTFRILSESTFLSVVSADDAHVYWNSHLIPNLAPQGVQINPEDQSIIEIANQETGEKYIYGKPVSSFTATSDFGTKVEIATETPRTAPQFIYNSSGSNISTDQYKTKDGKYIVKTPFDNAHRGGVEIYDAQTETLLHDVDLKSQLGGYRLLFTSPDEAYIYVIVGLYEFQSYSKLYRVEIATGKVSEVSGVNTMNTYNALYHSSGLSSDGTKLVFIESSNNVYLPCADFGRPYDTVMMLDTNTGIAQTLFKVKPSQKVSEITWLPDESGFTYAINEMITLDDYVAYPQVGTKPNADFMPYASVITCQVGTAGVAKTYYRYIY